MGELSNHVLKLKDNTILGPVVTNDSDFFNLCKTA
jgi:hypothetical protein